MKYYLSAALCALTLVAASGQASADCGGFGYGFGPFGGYYNYGIQPYVPAPPYFALHPPVYYGQRYTRPYGDSPFAAPSQLQPAASYAPSRHVERSLTIQNPWVAPLESAAEPVPAPVPAPVAVKPLVIDNPYFQAEVQFADRK